MRGMPQKIQTPEDLRNIYKLWQDATWQAQNGAIDTEVFISQIDLLCQQQFFHVPILKIESNGNIVITRFFHEAEVGCVTNGGLKVIAVEHFTPTEDKSGDTGGNTGMNTDGNNGEEETNHTCTKITFDGKFPQSEKTLRIKNICNCTDYNNFDTDEINKIRATLQDSITRARMEVR